MAHRVFIIFLVVVGLTAVIAVGLSGFEYYLTPLVDRPFRPDYSSMSPSGTYSHGLGIVGATMITVGVMTYSSRKRIRALWELGKLSSWLEFHIFLCLVGPVLVVYHTTFKAGGIAAISLWTMLSVAASGIVGRFLYVLIPRNLKGSELNSGQINQEFDRLGAVLRESEIGTTILRSVDKNFSGIRRPESFGETIATYFTMVRAKHQLKRSIRAMLAETGLSRSVAKNLYKAASARASLIQRSVILLQAEKLFYYWHAIHLPFSIMMFVTLAVHIGVAVWLGYHWIF
ncbi:MAG TPA: hypothetical protein VI758_08365 [Bacteroidota bacterium]